MRRALLLGAAVLLSGCGAAATRSAPASAPVLADSPAPPIASADAPAPAWVVGYVDGTLGTSTSGTDAWTCYMPLATPGSATTRPTPPCGPPSAEQKAEVASAQKLFLAGVRPVSGSEPRVVATLPLAEGGTASFIAWLGGSGQPCWATEVKVGQGGGGGGPEGPCTLRSADAGVGRPPCDALCLDSSGGGDAGRTIHVLAGTVPASAEALRVTLAGGAQATYPLVGPVFPGSADRRIFLLDLGAVDWRTLELVDAGAVDRTVRMPAEEVAFEVCSEKVGPMQPVAGNGFDPQAQQQAMQPHADAMNACLHGELPQESGTTTAPVP
jgi:hypothetical protein